ncbi:adenylate/guanylate cyclase domain-containing protein [Duganella sp. LX20W]|uniref:Adenylate/guanylate cyclase domain-containing protein n=2 Tax=Rugamonas brunnea TaxID=2758569 RepID=A0A7W2EWS3_9BURK|nr:adenylate/guanylate cyclase domain-containing protein [Rugamonas brunnea]
MALVALLLTVVPEFLPGHGYFAEEWLRDRYIRLHTTNAPEPRVLVVDIDEASLATLGSWPWPSSRIADLVEMLLTNYNARGVALDIVLPKAGDPDGDTRLALLANHGPLVLAQAFDYSATRPEPLRAGVLGGALAAAPAAVSTQPATGYLANHALLAQAPHIGNIGFIPDPDGALRRLPLLTSFEGRVYPALTQALLDCCAGASTQASAPTSAEAPAQASANTPPQASGKASPQMSPQTSHQAPAQASPQTSSQPAPFPADAAATRIDYRRDWSAYTVVSAADILAGRIAPDGASGRLALVGSSSLSLADRVTTPLAANRPGLGVQATMLSTLLDRRDGNAPAPWPGRWIACAYTLLLAALASYTMPRLSAARNGLLLGAGAALWLLLALAVSAHDASFSPSAPLASVAFLLAFAVPFQWQQTQHRSRYLLDTLRQYVAPAVVSELMRSDLKDPLAPRQLDVTTLIADMEGYTSQVEALPVDEAAKLTRDFLECLTEPVIANQGTLDKYTGDGLVAFWGAPLPHPRHADLALDAAQAIVRRVRALSQARVAQGWPPLRVRIGIESGLAMAGDFGTAFRSIYTAVGDSVNTAARLEQAARDYPHDVIVGAGTVARATGHQFLPLGERLLRGKEKPTTLYTIDTTIDTINDTHNMAERAAPSTTGVRERHA